MVLLPERLDDQIQSSLLNDPGSKVCHNPVTKIRWVHVVPGHKTCSAAEEDLSGDLVGRVGNDAMHTYAHNEAQNTTLFSWKM
jgi:hypothetical protein